MKLLITLIAMLGYGLWAYFANCYSGAVENPEMIATRAGIIQGAYAGALTFLNVIMLERIYKRLKDSFSHAQTVGIAVVIALIGQYAVIVPVHIFNGTPNILITLLPGLVIGTIFSISYTHAYAKKVTPAISRST